MFLRVKNGKRICKKINNRSTNRKICARSSLEYSGWQVHPAFPSFSKSDPHTVKEYVIINFFFRETHICRLCGHYGKFLWQPWRHVFTKILSAMAACVAVCENKIDLVPMFFICMFVFLEPFERTNTARAVYSDVNFTLIKKEFLAVSFFCKFYSAVRCLTRLEPVHYSNIDTAME